MDGEEAEEMDGEGREVAGPVAAEEGVVATYSARTQRRIEDQTGGHQTS